MDKSDFLTQIQRLKATYGDKAYPPERVEVLWKTFSRVTDVAFGDAVTACIGNSQYAPMLKHLEEAVEEAVRRERAELRSRARPMLTVVRTPNDTARSAELATFCKKLIEGRISGKISKEYFQQAEGQLNSWVRGLAKERGESLPCKECDGSGYTYNTRESGNEELCRCDCTAGAQRPEYLDYGKGVRLRVMTKSEAKNTVGRFQ